MSRRKIIGNAYFTGRSNIAIVITVDEFKEESAYIGTYSSNLSEKDSLIHIAQWGSKFPLEEAKTIIAKIGFSSNKIEIYVHKIVKEACVPYNKITKW